MSYREMAQFPIQLRIWQQHMFGDAIAWQALRKYARSRAERRII